MKIFKNSSNLSKSSGYTLITVVLIVTILVILATLGLGIALAEIKITKNQQGGVEALFAAETGANRALHYLENDWKVAFEDGNPVPGFTETVVPGTSGQTYKVTVDVKKTGSVVRATITSEGKSQGAKGEAKRGVQVVVEKQITLGSSPVGEVALYTSKGFTAGGGHWASLTIKKGDLWSDGDITIDGVKFLNMDSDKDAVYFGDLNKFGHISSDNSNYVQKKEPPLGSDHKLNLSSPVIAPFESYILNNIGVNKVSEPIFNTPCIYNGEAQIMPQIAVFTDLPQSPPPSCQRAESERKNMRVKNLASGTLMVGGTSSLKIHGDMYVEGNLSLFGNTFLEIDGYLVVDGGLVLSGSSKFKAKGVYLKGNRPMLAGANPPGSLVMLGNTFVDVGDIYVKGKLVWSSSSSLTANNFQIDGINQGHQAAFRLDGNTFAKIGTLLVPNGDVEIIKGAHAEFGNIKSGGNVTIDNYKFADSGNIYAKKNLVFKDGSSIDVGDPSKAVNLYAGDTLNFESNTFVKTNGLLVGVNGAQISDGASIRLNHKNGEPSGVISSGAFNANNLHFLHIDGLIWVKDDVNITSGSSDHIEGAVVSSGNIKISGVTFMTITYNGGIVDETFSGVFSSASGFKILDWRENY